MEPYEHALLWLIALCVFAICFIYATVDTQSETSQLHNAYWPFSVETSIQDRG